MAVKNRPLNNDKGIAILETVPMLVIFTMMLSYGVGMWGVVHTAVHNSMGARAYAFSTFNQRTDLTVLRDNLSQPAQNQFMTTGFRLHSIYSDEDDFNSNANHVATRRSITITDTPVSLQTQSPQPPPASFHNENVHEIGTESRDRSNPVWVQTSYGICLRAVCGD